MSIVTAPWFYWGLFIAIGLPVALVLLTELHNSLNRRGSAMVRPVGLLRNYVLPLGAMLLLIVKTSDISTQATGVRIVTTVLGFLVLLMLLAGLNARLFQSAPEGSWRRRLPSIFIDVARFVIIAVGVAVIFSQVWGANVGKLFTVLGIGSIVLGLTLQNSVGQIISGLLLLFEQPFKLGDWVETNIPSIRVIRGRVIEVNWRATHIDTGCGMEIIPNSVLAAATFANLSRPADSYNLVVESTFGVTDAPDAVCALLARVAAQLPQRRDDAMPVVAAASATGYSTTIPLKSPGDDAAARTTFQRWLWYASRRAGLHCGGADDDFSAPQDRVAALRKIAPILRLSHCDMEALLPHATIARYGDGELILGHGDIPAAMTFVIKGRIRLSVDAGEEASVPIRTLQQGDFLGQTALTREPVTGDAFAEGEVTVLAIKRTAMEELLLGRPALLQDISRAIDDRRAAARAATTGQADAEAGPDSNSHPATQLRVF
ncbi:MAG: mechanosensitive ion channel family protein [Mycobacterium sp.]